MQNEQIVPNAKIANNTAIDLMFTGFRRCDRNKTNTCIVSCNVPTANYCRSMSDFETRSFIFKVEPSTKVTGQYLAQLRDDMGNLVAHCIMDDMDK